MFNILFILRIDAKFKNGGDLLQAKQYKKVLEKKLLNQNIKIAFAHELDLTQLKETHWNLVILFNISRLDEHFYFLEKIDYDRIAFVPIVQPNYFFSLKEYSKSLLRGLLHLKYIPYNSLDKKLKLLSTCMLNIFLSNDECEYYQKQFVKTVNNVIVKNGIDIKHNIIYNKEERKIDFLIVGRVEKSKNTLNTLLLLNKYFPHLNTCFVGSYNKYHLFYFNKFKKSCKQNKNINYLGAISQNEVYEIMSMSKLLLNLSLKEVSPLVDIEALSLGMKVLSTKASFTHLEESNCFMRVNPLNEDEIVEKINQIIKKSCNNESSDDIITWDTSVEPLVIALKNIIISSHT